MNQQKIMNLLDSKIYTDSFWKELTGTFQKERETIYYILEVLHDAINILFFQISSDRQFLVEEAGEKAFFYCHAYPDSKIQALVCQIAVSIITLSRDRIRFARDVYLEYVKNGNDVNRAEVIEAISGDLQMMEEIIDSTIYELYDGVIGFSNMAILLQMINDFSKRNEEVIIKNIGEIMELFQLADDEDNLMNNNEARELFSMFFRRYPLIVVL